MSPPPNHSNHGQNEELENGKLVPVWRYMLTVSGAVVVLLMSIVGTLVAMGLNREMSQIGTVMTAISHKMDKLCEADAKIEKRLSALEILVTMSYEERMKALEKMRNFKAYGHGVHE